MGAPDIQRGKKITQELEVEREDMQEELDHGTAAALKKRGREEIKGTENAQLLSAALRKSEMAKGTLKKNFVILQRKSPDNCMGQSHLQVGTGTDLQSTPMSLKDSSDISHKEVGLYIPVSPGLLGQSSPSCGRQPCLSAWPQPETIDWQIVSWHAQNDCYSSGVCCSDQLQAKCWAWGAASPVLTQDHGNTWGFGFGVGGNGAGEQGDGLNPAEFCTKRSEQQQLHCWCLEDACQDGDF